MKKISVIFLFSCIALFTYAQVTVKGPYTVSVLDRGIYRIEDANPSNPAGVVLDKEGKTIHRNISSDMYLIVGGQKALLIDLSNKVEWDATATESLRSIVYERTAGKKLYISFTHKHGDHTGMLPAFKDDKEASFWIPEGEFKGMDIFPRDSTTYFTENASFDLGGGCIINTMEVPGHTDHGTLFFVKDRNMVFTGDAIGSGDGVLIFSYEAIFSFKREWIT